jgi:asparagine N-glycosylation enzyme membrane subunit Stt3
MIVLVYALCQPFGRDWDEKTTEMFTGEEGVFASDPDSYYYIRVAREFTENGIGSIRISPAEKDAFRTQRRTGESGSVPTLLSALAALVWYIAHFLGINVGVFTIAIRLCSFILATCTIPLYLFLRKRVSRQASVFGALVAVLSKPFFTHSRYGFFDTDALICLFALTAVLAMYDCCLSKEIRKQIVYGAIFVSALIALYFTWNTYYVYALISVGTAVVGFIAVRIICRSKLTTKEKMLPIGIIVSILAIVVLTRGDSVLELVKSLFVKSKSSESWPNPAGFVGEMKRPVLFEGETIWSFFLAHGLDVISYMGGGATVLALLLSIGVACKDSVSYLRKKAKAEVIDGVFLFASVATWLFGTSIMVLFGMRFFEFVILPSSIVLAYGENRFYEFMTERNRSLLIKRVLIIIFSGILFASFVIIKPVFAVSLAGTSLMLAAFASSKCSGAIISVLACIAILASDAEVAWIAGSDSTPYFAIPQEKAMQWIDENTSSDAVLANDWSQGYAYQYYGRRRTISDGGMYNGAYFFWLETMWASNDLKLSAGIARMLQENGLDGTDYVFELTGNIQDTVNILKGILPLSRCQAKEYLVSLNRFSAEQIDRILDFSHPQDCPDIYMVLSSFMLHKASLSKTAMEWDFVNGSEQQGATFIGAESVLYPEEGTTAYCEIGIDGGYYGWRVWLSNLDGKIIGIVTSPDGIQVECSRTVYYKNGEKQYDERDDLPLSEKDWIEKETLIIIEDEGRLSVLICEDALVDSTLFTLYVYRNQTQKIFEKVFECAVPERISGELSMTQRMVGTSETDLYVDCGISIWRVNSEIISAMQEDYQEE